MTNVCGKCYAFFNKCVGAVLAAVIQNNHSQLIGKLSLNSVERFSKDNFRQCAMSLWFLKYFMITKHECVCSCSSFNVGNWLFRIIMLSMLGIVIISVGFIVYINAIIFIKVNTGGKIFDLNSIYLLIVVKYNLISSIG